MVSIPFNLDIALQLFVLLNPLSSFPFLLSAHSRHMNVRIIAVKSVITAFVIAIVMALIGPSLFGFFGISIDAFRIAGGIVLLLLGLNMVRPKEDESKQQPKAIDGLVAIIATPMLTGPATISFITIKAHEFGRALMIMNVIAAFVVVGLVFILFSFFVEKVNPKLVNILSRVLGLFLMAIAIEMMLAGIKAVLVPVLQA